MRSRSTRAITNRQPFRNQPTRNIDKINLLPHLQQRGTARKQTQEQTTRLIIPRAIIDRTRLQILQRAGRDRQTKLSRSNSSPQRKARIGLRIGTRRKHDLLLMLGDTGRDHIKRRRLTLTAATRLEHLEKRKTRLLMSQRMLSARSRGIKRKRDLATNTRKQRLQIINRLRLTLAARQRRISQTQHRRNLRLIRSEQHIRVFIGHQMNAIAHIQQPFDGIVILAVRAVGKPRSGKRGDQHGITQTTARLLNIRLIAIRHTAELIQTRLGGTQQFGQALTGGPTPTLQNGDSRGFNQLRIARNRHHIQPTHRSRQIMVGHRLALRAGTHRLVKIKTRIPNRIPQFVGKLIELLVGERVRLINDHQVKIGTRSHLAAGQRTHRAKTNAGLRNVKRHRLASLLPQLFEAIHGQIRTSLALHRTIAVHAVGIRLTHIHETLFKTINR